MSVARSDNPELARESMLPVRVDNECGRLRRVVIGNPEHFEVPDPINKKQLVYHAEHPETPTRETLRPEFARFRRALEDCGVEVLEPVPLEIVPDQLTPRDIGFVVGDVFVISRMATECRRREWRGIQALVDRMDPSKVMKVDADVIVEGGDVILDREILFVGISERTTPEGAAWMQSTFGDRYEVVPVHLHSDAEHHDILHLDCAFVPTGPDHALIFPAGIDDLPEAITDRYRLIEVTKAEQHQLETNVLNVEPGRVISRSVATRVNDELRRAGLDVIEIAFDETPKMGGSFRCASLPLLRDPIE